MRKVVGGKLVDHALELLAQDQAAEIGPLFQQLANVPNAIDSRKQLVQAVVTILSGSRDQALADDPALNYVDAAEVLWLFERFG